MGMRARRNRPLDYWPGFVDALAALLMVTVFVILIFVIGQFVFADAVGGRDRALSRLNAELAALASTLSLETAARERAERQIGELSATLGEQIQARNAETARLEADVAALAQLKSELESRVAMLAGALDQTEKSRSAQVEISDRALAQVELLNR
jgi:chemotaxis protein MotB